MEILQLLGVAVGLASLAGLNLYLTVFLTGLAIRLDWIALAPEYHRLEVLGDPLVLIVSGLLFVMEFLADKVPWVDSAWDAVHTAIRPVGAALLAIMVLGEGNAAFNVVVGLLAAWLGFTTHALKATVRLQANASPEPITNSVLSLVEDATVVLGLALIFTHPILALVLAVLLLAAIWWFVPRMLRATAVKLWLCGRKLRLAPDEPVIGELPVDLALPTRLALESDAGTGASVAWAVRCISGTGQGLPRHRFGTLALVEAQESRMYFVHGGARPRLRPLPAGRPAMVRLEHKFLADVLVLGWSGEGGEGGEARFLFERGSRNLARRVVEQITAGPAVETV